MRIEYILYVVTDDPYIHELAVTAQQLASVAQLVRALHQNHRFDSCQRT